MAGIHRQLGNRGVQRLIEQPDGGVPDRGSNAGITPGIQRMCPRCRRRAREGKPLNCQECEAEVQRSESTNSGGTWGINEGHDPGPAELSMSEPGDKLEREAEAVASAVMRMPNPRHQDSSLENDGGTRVSVHGDLDTIAGRGLFQRMCSRCSKRLVAGKRLNCTECEKEMQRKSKQRSSKCEKVGTDTQLESGSSSSSQPSVAASVGTGRPLAEPTRQFLEPRFGYDFSNVRIHTDPKSGELSKSFNARAFTYGNHIFFGRGEYRPTSRGGRRLLAHELTHTIQQGTGMQLQTIPETGLKRSDPISREKCDNGCGTTIQRAARELGQGSNRSRQRSTITDDQLDASKPEQTWAEWGWESGKQMVEWGTEKGREAVEWGTESVSEVGQAAWEYGESTVVTIGNTAVRVASSVWSTAQSLANAIGGTLSWEDGSIIIYVKEKKIPLDIPTVSIDPPSTGVTLPFIKGGFTVGMVTFTGTASLSTEVDPAIKWDIGQPIIDRFRMELDPFGTNINAQGSMNLPTRMRLNTSLSAGLQGSLRTILTLPTDPPIPIVFPSVGLAGGLAGHGTGSARSDLTLRGTGSGSLGSLQMNMTASGKSDIDADIGLSGWEAVMIEGFELCRHHWPLWSKNITATLTGKAGLSMSAGLGGFDIDPDISPPDVTDINFADLSKEAEENLINGDCRLCELFKSREWFASQNELSPYYMQPGDQLAGPLEVYPHHPFNDLDERGSRFQEETLCRGACGWNCKTCNYQEKKQVEGYDQTGQRVTWTYYGFYDCDTHAACREHDACFDWAAAEGGETGSLWALLGPDHWICNIKCYCDHSASECTGFIFGAGGDGKMFFAENPPVPIPVDEREGPPDRPGPDDPKLNGRDGSSPGKALPFKIHKPWKRYSLYPESLVLPRAISKPYESDEETGAIEINREDGPTAVEYPFRNTTKVDEFGVRPSYWPEEGDLLQYHSGRRDSEKDRFKRVVERLGGDLSGLQADHVRELQFGEAASLDQFDNLWPMDSSANMSAGRLQRSEFRYYESLFGTLRNRWFEITEIDIGPPYLPGDLY